MSNKSYSYVVGLENVISVLHQLIILCAELTLDLLLVTLLGEVLLPRVEFLQKSTFFDLNNVNHLNGTKHIVGGRRLR